MDLTRSLDVECGINFSKPSRLIINQTKPGKPGECIEMKKMKKSRRPKERHVEKFCQPDIDDKQCDAESNQHYPECNVEDTNQCCADTRGRDMQDTRENHIDEAETKESDIESCRICQEASDHSPLVSPCKCSGSIQFVHIDCLEDWIDSTGDTVCEICQTRYDITANMKPFKEWTRFPDAHPFFRNFIPVAGTACFIFFVLSFGFISNIFIMALAAKSLISTLVALILYIIMLAVYVAIGIYYFRKWKLFKKVFQRGQYSPDRKFIGRAKNQHSWFLVLENFAKEEWDKVQACGELFQTAELNKAGKTL